jgi:methionyl-tRNA formyltransferase
MLTKTTGQIDWSKSAQEVHNLVRGLNSWPGAYTSLDGAKYKIWRTRRTGEQATAPAGTVVRADKKTGLFVAAGDEVLEILELQAPGKKKMGAADYLNGHGFAAGAKFD